MKPCLLSLGAGLIVGLVYSLMGVRSPAPPIIALAGLLGILLGEQMLPAAKHMLSGQGAAAHIHDMGRGQIDQEEDPA
jgi:XapX domain-containing protein